MTPPRVLSVGQCGFDQGRIARSLRDDFGVGADAAETPDEAIDALRSGQYRLALVNRVFDLDGSPGLDLIRAIKADPALAAIPTMLVSDHPDAQDAATALGALPGFGKADLGRPKSRAALAAALGQAQAR